MKGNLVRNVKLETYIGSSNRFVLSTIKVSTIQCTIQYPESNQKRRPQTKNLDTINSRTKEIL